MENFLPLTSIHASPARQTEEKVKVLFPKQSFNIPVGSTWLVILWYQRAQMDLF